MSDDRSDTIVDDQPEGSRLLRVDADRDFYRGIMVLKYNRLGLPTKHRLRFVEDGSQFRHHIVWHPVERKFSLWRKIRKHSQPHRAYRKIALPDVIKIDAPNPRSKTIDVCDPILERAYSKRSANGNDFENLYAVITKRRPLVVQFDNPSQRNKFRDFIAVRLSVIVDARRVQEENMLMSEEERKTRKFLGEEKDVLNEEIKQMNSEDNERWVVEETVMGTDAENENGESQDDENGDSQDDDAAIDASPEDNSDQSETPIPVDDGVDAPGSGIEADGAKKDETDDATKDETDDAKKDEKNKKKHKHRKKKEGEGEEGQDEPDSGKKKKHKHHRKKEGEGEMGQIELDEKKIKKKKKKKHKKGENDEEDPESEKKDKKKKHHRKHKDATSVGD